MNLVKPLLRLLLASATALAPLLLQAQEKLTDFSLHQAIQLLEPAPYYRLTLPIELYQRSAHGDLRDLRVFNAAGVAVPHTRLAASGEMAVQTQKHTLHWFPLKSGSASTAETPEASFKLVVQRNNDGSLVEIEQKTGKPETSAAAETIRGYVLDASSIQARETLRSLELDWAASSADFQLLDLEASDDLQQWRRVQTGIQLARLQFNGASIEKRRIELAGLREPYLRLIWREPAKAPTLTSAIAEQSASRWEAAPTAWSAPMPPVETGRELKPGEYAYKLPVSLPIRQLRVLLPPGNVLLPIEVLTPAPERRRWRSIGRGIAYRINNQDREWTQTDLPLSGSALDGLVLRIDPRSNTLPHGPLISYAIEPAQLIFLASGEGPFQIAIGNTKATDTALPATTLIPGFGSPNSPKTGQANLQAPQAIHTRLDQASTTLKNAEPHRDWRKITLWGVLIAGVLGMGGMVWRLMSRKSSSRTEH